FPIGADSLRTIQRQLNNDQVSDLVCYETRLIPSQASKFDAYVFSSPSNVKSFLAKNTIAPGSKIISFGPSTSKALSQSGINDVIQLKEYSDEAIAMAILSV
ncbi:MAG: hypothetical protein RL018_440, partial [Pseudomonadota bacterium]